MKILIDTNVLIDYVTSREPGTQTANAIIDKCIDEEYLFVSNVDGIRDRKYVVSREEYIKKPKNVTTKFTRHSAPAPRWRRFPGLMRNMQPGASRAIGTWWRASTGSSAARRR